jgi:DNA-binding NarL/FixJ family response regulator
MRQHSRIRRIRTSRYSAVGGPGQRELARTEVLTARASRLTDLEQPVAELAGSGMTNRDVASALLISPKTVEANLLRKYRKLGTHSRAELGRVMGHSDR